MANKIIEVVAKKRSIKIGILSLNSLNFFKLGRSKELKPWIPFDYTCMA
jgi:hypothetical protein